MDALFSDLWAIGEEASGYLHARRGRLIEDESQQIAICILKIARQVHSEGFARGDRAIQAINNGYGGCVECCELDEIECSQIRSVGNAPDGDTITRTKLYACERERCGGVDRLSRSQISICDPCIDLITDLKLEAGKATIIVEIADLDIIEPKVLAKIDEDRPGIARL